MASEAVPKAYRIAAAPFVVVSAILLYFTLVTPSAAWLHAALLADVAGILVRAFRGSRRSHPAKPPGTWTVLGSVWFASRPTDRPARCRPRQSGAQAPPPPTARLQRN